MKWPTGRYNGRRIEGFAFRFRLHALFWYWRPRIGWNFGEPYFRWLCFSMDARPEYF